MTQVTPSYPASSQTVAAFVAVLRSAQVLGSRVITRLKIAKLLYLTDLRAVERGDEPVSGVEWRWLQHGPYNNDLLFLENYLVTAGNITRDRFYKGWALQLMNEPPIPTALPEDSIALIHEVVRGFGKLAANSLKDLSYQTAPMIEAQRRGRGTDVILDLDLVRPKPNLAQLSRQMRDVVTKLEPQDTDPDAFDDLLADMQRHRAGLGRANDTLLGDA